MWSENYGGGPKERDREELVGEQTRNKSMRNYEVGLCERGVGYSTVGIRYQDNGLLTAHLGSPQPGRVVQWVLSNERGFLHPKRPWMRMK